MKRKRPFAFTLVELLVVITIIGMLMSLLLPAVQAARESARRVQCTNNQHQIQVALFNYESSYQAFPGLRSYLAYSGTAGGGRNVSWTVPILPQLDRADLYGRWRSPTSGADDRNRFLRFMYCPSDPPDTMAATDTPSAYTINGLICRDPIAQDCGAAWQNLPPRSLEYVSQQDGTQCTLLLAENVRVVLLPGVQSASGFIHSWTDWNLAAVNSQSACLQKTISFGTSMSGGTTDYKSFSAVYDPQMYNNIRSNHSGGVVAVFCDGHAGFLRDDINSTLTGSGAGGTSKAATTTLYHALVSPDGCKLENEAPVSDEQLP